MQRVDNDFKERVYMLVSQIPRGRVMTYGQIAALAGAAWAAWEVGQIAHFAPCAGLKTCPANPMSGTGLDEVQGKAEQRTEAYMKYGEGVAQSLTPQRTLSDDGASGSARRQDVTVRGTWFEPATPMAIMWLLAGYGVDLAGKHILLVGRGKLVGAPLEKILKASGYEVEVIGREVKNLSDYTKKADVIITATGSPAVLYPDMIKTGAVVVDAGVASESGKTVGDLAPEVYQRDDLIITPEKGGVGPLTVCALFENVIRAADNLPRTKS